MVSCMPLCVHGLGVLFLWGNEPLLSAVDGSPAHGRLPSYIVGRLGAISSPHRDDLQLRGLRSANLRRLHCDVVLTTILLHKRHAEPVLPLLGNYSPQKGGLVDKTLVNDPPPEWYRVANWSPRPGAARWPAWDVILSQWLSGDVLLAPDVWSAMATRRRQSPYRVVYVHFKYNRIPTHTREEIEWGVHDVVIEDASAGTGLPPISRAGPASGPSITVVKDGAWRLASVEMRSPLGVPHFIQPSSPSSVRHPKAPAPSTRTCRCL